MATYSEIQAQITELKKQAEQIRQNELADAKTRIADIMRQHGLTLADLQVIGKPAKTVKERVTVPAKYRDPTSGQEWTGRGRAPKWIEGQDKDKFLIQGAA